MRALRTSFGHTCKKKMEHFGKRLLGPRPLYDVNPHVLDCRVQFIESTHTYIIDGDVSHSITSVTTLVHKFFRHFDADAVIDKMSRSPSFSESKYFGMSPDEIKADWERNRDEAAQAGTRMHKSIENVVNGFPAHHAFAHGTALPSANVPCRELEMFNEYASRVKSEGLVPFRTEWVVFSKPHNLAGSIDMVYRAPDGSLVLADWKRSKKINMANRYQRGIGPCKHLDDCNFVHYTLQLNLYRRIIEMHYGERVSDMRLVILHPAQTGPIVLKVQRLDAEIDAMLETCGNV